MRPSSVRFGPLRFGPVRFGALALAGALVLAGCGSGSGSSTASPPSSAGSVHIELSGPPTSAGAASAATTDPSAAIPPTVAAGAPGPSAASGGSGSSKPPSGPGSGSSGAGSKGTAPSAPVAGQPTRPAPPVGVGSATYSVVAQAKAATVVARTQPGAAAPAVAELHNPIASGAALVFEAVEGGRRDKDWIEVLLPVKPNGTTGWVARKDVTLTNNPYRIEIDRASFSLRVYKLTQLWVDTTIAVGNGATPTPVGRFYLMELLAPPDPKGTYGPYAFGLSGFSEVLDSFGGSNQAIIGIHGTNDPTSLGHTVSHGCIRVNNTVIRQLATTLPLGTPVHIT